MVCSKCGTECPDGTKFCTNCGAQMVVETAPAEEAKVEEVKTENAAEETKAEEVKQEEVKQEEVKQEEAKTEAPAEQPKKEEAKSEDSKEEKPKKEKKPFPAKKVLVPLVALVAAIVVICVLCGVIKKISGKKYAFRPSKKQILGLTTYEDQLYVFMGDGSSKKLNVEKGKKNQVLSSDASAIAFDSADEVLYVFANGKLISTEYDKVTDVTFAPHGNMLAFLTETKSGKGNLVVFDVAKKKAYEVDEDVKSGSVVFSPDGKTFAYIGDYEASDDFKGYYCKVGGKSKSIGKEKVIVAIANKAKRMYYTEDDKLYFKKGKKEGQKLAKEITSTNIFVNYSLSQIIYNKDGDAYFSENGSEPQKVCERVVSVVQPCDRATASFKASKVTVQYTFAKKLKNMLLVNGEAGLYVLSSYKDRAKKVASSVSSVIMSENGKKLVYVSDSDNIVSMTDFTKGDNGKKKTLVKEAECVRLLACDDLKYVWYVNKDEELYYIKGSKAKRVADDVSYKSNLLTLSKDGKYAYFVIDDEDLYVSKKGSKKSKIFTKDEILLSVADVNIAMVTQDDTAYMYKLTRKNAKETFKLAVD